MCPFFMEGLWLLFSIWCAFQLCSDFRLYWNFWIQALKMLFLSIFVFSYVVGEELLTPLKISVEVDLPKVLRTLLASRQIFSWTWVGLAHGYSGEVVYARSADSWNLHGTFKFQSISTKPLSNNYIAVWTLVRPSTLHWRSWKTTISVSLHVLQVWTFMLTSAQETKTTSQASQIKDVAILITQGTYAIAQEEGNCQSFSPILSCDFHGFHGFQGSLASAFFVPNAWRGKAVLGWYSMTYTQDEVLGLTPRELDQIATASRAIRWRFKFCLSLTWEGKALQGTNIARLKWGERMTFPFHP